MCESDEVFKPLDSDEIINRFYGGAENYKRFISAHSCRPWEHDAAAVQELEELLDRFLGYLVGRYVKSSGEYSLGMEYGLYKEIPQRIEWFCRRYNVKDPSIKKFIEMISGLREKKGQNPAPDEVQEVFESVKKVCQQLSKKIQKEAKA
jgi:hypothetical protein